MKRYLKLATDAVRSAFHADGDTARYLEKIHVDVRRNGRHWGF